jgi:hypothetical protein
MGACAAHRVSHHAFGKTGYGVAPAVRQPDVGQRAQRVSGIWDKIKTGRIDSQSKQQSCAPVAAAGAFISKAEGRAQCSWRVPMRPVLDAGHRPGIVANGTGLCMDIVKAPGDSHQAPLGRAKRSN